MNQAIYIKRSKRIRKKLKKINTDRLRLSIYRSSRNISAQIIDDKNNKTLVSVSSLGHKTTEKDKKSDLSNYIAEVLAKKSLTGAIRNIDKLETKLASFKDKPQGKILHSMAPSPRQIKSMRAILNTMDKIDDGMGAMFTDAWEMLKKK